MSAPPRSNSSPPKAYLLHLPTELLFMITRDLESSQDTINLMRSCKSLWHTLDHLEVYKKDASYQLSHANDFTRIRVRMLRALYHFPSPCDPYDVTTRGTHYVALGADHSKPWEPILHWAIRKHVKFNRVEQIVRIYKDISPAWLHDAWHPSWPSPMTAAVAANRLDVAQLLLLHGCAIHGNDKPIYPRGHARTVSKEDTLLVACSLGYEPMANFLLDNGAAPRLWHMAFAGATRMIHTLPRLASAVNFPGDRPDWERAGWVCPELHIAICGDDSPGPNQAVIDFYMAQVPALGRASHLEYAVGDCLQQGYVKNAAYLFRLLCEDEDYSPLGLCVLVSRCPRSDRQLAITKQMHERYGAVRMEKGRRAGAWTVTKHMLLAAIRSHPGDDSNVQTIEFLLGTDSPVSSIHLDAALRSPYLHTMPSVLINLVREKFAAVPGTSRVFDSLRGWCFGQLPI